ncbi:rhomboid family intramembrane serine protease [Bacteroidetes/Chlorobi group bacterium Naka2016]|nr:MAG: rhomboid family intramembrane serine protease [Bacteroidetes/Chlorobi group bacterium Naka2016]
MELRYKTVSLSRVFLGIFLVAHIVFYFIGNEIAYSLLALNPRLVIFDIQIWRLFTFPLVSLSIPEAFLFAYTFWVLGPKVENCFHKNYFLLSLVIFIFLQGFLTTALFGKENFYLVGTEGLSFYLITLYYLIYFRIVSQYETLPLRSMVQTAFVIFFWLMASMLDSYIYERNTLVNSFSFALVGIFVGSLSYLQNRSFAIELLQQRYLDFISFRKKLEEFESEEMDELITKKNETEMNEASNLPKEEIKVNLSFTEDNLNRILDKILEKGKESLTPEEIKFLKEYSKKLNKYGEK